MVDDIERIAAAQISVPAGHYSHATAWNGLVFASGQLGARGDDSHTCESAWGSDAERHAKSLRSLIWARSFRGSDAYLMTVSRITRSRAIELREGRFSLGHTFVV